MNSDSHKEKYWPLLLRKDVISWSLYDFANTIFSMNIVSSYFKPWVVTDLGKPGYMVDITLSLSMLAVMLLSPALGALADHGSRRKFLLLLFTVSSISSLIGFSLLPASLLAIILILFALATFFYEGGMVFYNSLLYSIVDTDREGRFVSGVGVAVGYVGTIVGLYALKPFVESSGNAGAFLPTAGMFLLFSIPLFLFVKERGKSQGSQKDKAQKFKFRETYRFAINALSDSERYPGLPRFLAVDFLVKNAMHGVIINIGVFTAVVIGLDASARIPFLATVSISAVIGSFIIGKIAVEASLRKMIIYASVGWIICLIGFGFAQHINMQWALASFAGVLLGAVWTIHRPYMAELVPSSERGRFFGFYSITGKGAAVIAPLWWALFFKLFQPADPLGKFVSELLSLSASAQEQLPYRAAAMSLSILVAAGLLIFVTGKSTGEPERD